MKVLYLFLDGTKSRGVINKVKSKIRFLNEHGLDVTGVFMNKDITERSYNKEEKIHYVPLVIKPLPFFYNRRFIRDYKWHFAAKSYLRQFYAQLNEVVDGIPSDLILFRYPTSNKFLLDFVKRHPGKVVFEHNSKELVEMRMDAEKSPAMKYYVKAEEEYAPEVLSYALGVTGVGKEVTAYQLSRCNTRTVPSAVISNGIDVNSLPVRTPASYDGRLQLLFVTGSPSPWVGIDILLNSLTGFGRRDQIEVTIVGRVTKELEDLVKKSGLEGTVKLVGEKYGAELHKCFDEAHVAIGTLAMQRVGLKEHSSLKVLEYAARGIPFVISYEDTNFAAVPEFAPYYLQLPYDGKKIDLDKLIEFGIKMSGDVNHPKVMHDLAVRYLDSTLRMKELEVFLRNITHE